MIFILIFIILKQLPNNDIYIDFYRSETITNNYKITISNYLHAILSFDSTKIYVYEGDNYMPSYVIKNPNIMKIIYKKPIGYDYH